MNRCLSLSLGNKPNDMNILLVCCYIHLYIKMSNVNRSIIINKINRLSTRIETHGNRNRKSCDSLEDILD